MTITEIRDVLDRAYGLSSVCFELLGQKECFDKSFERDDKLTGVLEHLQKDLVLIREALSAYEFDDCAAALKVRTKGIEMVVS